MGVLNLILVHSLSYQIWGVYLSGPYVEAVSISPHKLEWLNIKEKVLSGNRGVATRIKKGFFFRSLSTIRYDSLDVSLIWEDIEVDLVINKTGCRICRKKN